MSTVDLSNYREVKDRYFERMLWALVNNSIFRCLPGTRLAKFRNALIRAFGGHVAKRCNIYNTVKIYAPWKLFVGSFATIGPRVNIYNKAEVHIGSNATVSQGTFICTASHDICSRAMTLVSKPVRIGDGAWIAAECFVGPGVSVGEGAVASARSCLFKDVEAWEVVRGNPAVKIATRTLATSSRIDTTGQQHGTVK